jgi:arylsulfatase A-like enzyme
LIDLHCCNDAHFAEAIMTRVVRLRVFILDRFLAVALGLLLCGQAYAAGEKPNVILFVVDDMGWQDTSVPFWTKETPLNRRYRTPNMERLASEGVKFTHARAHAVCSPTRVAIMTGQNPARSRVTNWTKDRDVIPSTGDVGRLLAPRNWSFNSLQPLGAGIPNSIEAPTLAYVLKEAGYRTIHVGKAHWGSRGTPGEVPANLGFDDNIGGWSGGAPGSYLGTLNFGNKKGRHSQPWGVPGLEAYHGQDIFLSESLTREAIKLVDQSLKERQPFFLHMSHYAVHEPVAVDKRFASHYPHLSGAQLSYATMIEGMDKSLGDLLDHLETRDVAESTIVIFVSDNGGLSAPHLAGNAPLRAGKGSGYEGGLRVPMIIRATGIASAGAVCSTNVISEDLFPTILALAGVRMPNGYAAKVDGRDVTPLLRRDDGGKDSRPLFFHQPHKHTGDPYSAVVRGEWKLLFWHKSESFSLYDLSSDIGEIDDVANTMTDQAQELTGLLVAYLDEVDAQFPIFKKSGLPVAIPQLQHSNVGVGTAGQLVK